MTVGGFIATTLRITGWVSINILASLGVVVLAMFTLGSFTLHGTMLQLNNLTSRFVSADGARQAQLAHILVWGIGLSFFLIGLFRRKSAVDALNSEVGV